MKIKCFKKMLVAALVVVLVSGCSQRQLFSKKKLLMGTVVEVVSPYPEAAAIAFNEIERVEKVFSSHIPDSPVSHLNETGFLNTNFEVAFLFEKAKEFYNLTNGMFDVSVFPLSRLWKKCFMTKILPDAQEIITVLPFIGSDKIYIDHESKSIKFKRKGMAVDFGAIAKGYAVDAAVKELKRSGIDSAIIRAGGDIYCLGNKFDKPWNVGVQHPRKQNAIMTTIPLRDMAVSTSGDYQQFVDIGGRRYHHIINPKTGYPIENEVVSVSVVAKDATTADTVATCVFLLGKEQGMKKFQKHPGVEQIIVVTKNDLP